MSWTDMAGYGLAHWIMFMFVIALGIVLYPVARKWRGSCG
jgi:hypothetical protein